MTRRTGRGIVRSDRVLEKLRVGRDGAVQVTREAKIGTPAYRAASEVLDAIDDLAAKLTGDPAYFHSKPASTDDQV